MIGTDIGGYRIISELAEGGMGVVYRGESIDDGTPVAIKFLRKDLSRKQEDIGRFIREGEIYERLQHPNLIRFYKSGSHPKAGPFLVTELLEGVDLEELLEENGVGQPLELGRAVDIALQVCAGLAAAHEEGIIHRDLKPANIFIVQHDDGTEQAKVFDFGIGKLLEESGGGGGHKLTMVGSALGTPLYMAPEQIRGLSEKLGPAVDLYALGIIMFQMVTGTLPYVGDTPMMILSAHLKSDIPLLRKHQRYLAGTDLETLVRELMAKEISERPASLKKVKQRLWHIKQILAPEDTGATQMAMPAFDEEAMRRMSNPQYHSESSDTIDDLDAIDGLPTEPAIEKPAAVILYRNDEGEDEELAWLLPGERLQIGSAHDVGARLQHAGLQKQHAELYCAPQRWITIKSIDGAVVRVNGASVTSMVLRDGDTITLGRAELRLRCFAP